jgi:hypothetical protein
MATKLSQLVTGRLGQDPPGDQHRTDERLTARASNSCQFRIPELAVKSRIVSDQGHRADKVRHLGHDLLGLGCLAQHGGADAGQLGDEGRHAHPCVHQALVAVNDLSVAH